MSALKIEFSEYEFMLLIDAVQSTLSVLWANDPNRTTMIEGLTALQKKLQNAKWTT